jgi:type IV pilus assembly protein PilB
MNDITLSGLAKQLVQAELLTETSARQSWAQAQHNRVSLVNYLVHNKLVNSRQIAEIASEHFGMALLDLHCVDKESQPKGLVSEKLVRQHCALPLWRRGNKLFVGLSDPSNQQAISDIQFSTGLSTEAILVEDDKLSDAIDKFFESHASGLEEMADVDLDGLDVEAIDDNKQDVIGGLDADDAPVVRFVHKMLLDAIKSGSSDLHFEPYEKNYRVRMRTDGMLREVAKPPIQLAGRIAARLKVMASLDISERRKPQDGRIKMRLSKSKSIDFRVNTLPTLWAKKW